MLFKYKICLSLGRNHCVKKRRKYWFPQCFQKAFFPQGLQKSLMRTTGLTLYHTIPSSNNLEETEFGEHYRKL